MVATTVMMVRIGVGMVVGVVVDGWGIVLLLAKTVMISVGTVVALVGRVMALFWCRW